MEEVLVRYMSFPDIEDGVTSFYHFATDKRCAEPSKRYTSSTCHTLGDELDELALKVGFKKREAFAKERKKRSWKNSYAKELSAIVGSVLETQGIVWHVDGKDILFRCPKDEFISWPKNKK
ncbi:hypothetical protein [Peribacillus glennii]|uniref:Uncharacterized protein n=1 Tax=Peribacillus glennii TaxID=2303991 RepID=A0A372L7A4_9BACI|nr:hypothetical protein [Peribacillus glennii]RFU61113.1 hypothetical protein D0466_19205 [Peribacillus glennii]